MVAINIGLTATVVGLCAVLALPAVAAPEAQPAFDAFRQVCGDTHDDYAAVTAALDGAGWKVAEVKATTMDGVKVAEQTSRAKRAGDVDLTMFAWRGATAKGVLISACTVRVTKVRIDALKASAQAWTGFAPQTVDGKKIAFQFTDDGAAHRALARADFDAAAAAGGLEMFTVSADGSETILDLLKIKK